MHLEEALERLQSIVEEIEGKQLPLHEVMALHSEGQKLVTLSEGLLSEAKGKLKLTEVEVDTVGDQKESSTPAKGDTSDEVSLF